jgi:hypothetical protein
MIQIKKCQAHTERNISDSDSVGLFSTERSTLLYTHLYHPAALQVIRDLQGEELLERVDADGPREFAVVEHQPTERDAQRFGA